LTVLALATMANMTQINVNTDRIISIGQGKYIRHDIVGIIVCDIGLNFANVKTALATKLPLSWASSFKASEI